MTTRKDPTGNEWKIVQSLFYTWATVCSTFGTNIGVC